MIHLPEALVSLDMNITLVTKLFKKFVSFSISVDLLVFSSNRYFIKGWLGDV